MARILEDPREQDRYIATTQIGISIASLGLGMYGEHVLAEWIEPWFAPYDDNPWIAAHALASGIAVGILTYLHIVLGEMVPKALALQSADTDCAVCVAGHRSAGGSDQAARRRAERDAATRCCGVVGIRRQESRGRAVSHAARSSNSS